MNIVLICDRNYLMPTKVTINSIIKNKKEKEILNIYIIGVGLSFTDFDLILQLQDMQVSIVPIIPDDCFEHISAIHQHVTKAALYKFMIPELINEDKVLYLDSDVLVLESLTKLYETDIGNMYAAVVRDMIGECLFHFQQKHKISYYFNSGMMLLNLKELRKHGIVQKLISMKEADTSDLFMDQDTFNKVFDKKIILMSPKYNYILTKRENVNYSLDEIAEFYGLENEEVEEIEKHPVILHLTNKKKPWNSSEVNSQNLWYQYAFIEDFPQIIQNIVCSWKKENETLKLQLKHQEEIQRLMLEQEEENILFYKNNRQFIIDDTNLSGVMDKVWKNRKEISEYIAKWVCDNECKIVIYGAGKMGQAVFKCLWFLNYVEYVVGFAVRDKEDNVKELYGKKILALEEYGSINANIIVAVKNIPGDEIRQKMAGKNYKDMLEISRTFK